MVCGKKVERCVFGVEKALSFNLETFGDNDRNYHEKTRNVLQRFSKYVSNLNLKRSWKSFFGGIIRSDRF